MVISLVIAARCYASVAYVVMQCLSLFIRFHRIHERS